MAATCKINLMPFISAMCRVTKQDAFPRLPDWGRRVQENCSQIWMLRAAHRGSGLRLEQQLVAIQISTENSSRLSWSLNLCKPGFLILRLQASPQNSNNVSSVGTVLPSPMTESPFLNGTYREKPKLCHAAACWVLCGDSDQGQDSQILLPPIYI